MSDFSTTDNDKYGKEIERHRKQKHNKKKKLFSITNRESIYKKENHFSIGVSRFKTYTETATRIINTNSHIAIVTNNYKNKVRYDVYGNEIKKGSKRHKVSFIDESKKIPIVEVHEYCDKQSANKGHKAALCKNINSLSIETDNVNDKDVVYCSPCMII